MNKVTFYQVIGYDQTIDPETKTVTLKNVVAHVEDSSAPVKEDGSSNITVGMTGSFSSANVNFTGEIITEEFNKKYWKYDLVVLKYDSMNFPQVSRDSICQALNAHFEPITFVVDNKTSCIDITLPENKYILDITLILKESFYSELEKFLMYTFGFDNINYNNTRSCFWNSSFFKS